MGRRVAGWIRRFGLGRAEGRGRRDADPGPDRYVEELSDALYRRALGEGGWAVDIGVYGPTLFRADARRIVQHIAVGGATSGPPSP